jgi:hypothetical protein
VSSPRSCAASAAVCTLTPCLVMISTSSSLLDWAVPGPSAHQRLTAASIVASRSVSVSEERSSLKSGSSVLLAHLMVLLRALGNRALSGSGARAVCSGERSGELSGERISGARSGKASAYAAEGAQAATTQRSAGLIYNFWNRRTRFTPRGGGARVRSRPEARVARHRVATVAARAAMPPTGKQATLGNFFAARPAHVPQPCSDEGSAPAVAVPRYGRAHGKKMCLHGARCYRKSPAHFMEEDHPPDHPLIASEAGSSNQPTSDTPAASADVPVQPARSTENLLSAKKRARDDGGVPLGESGSVSAGNTAAAAASTAAASAPTPAPATAAASSSAIEGAVHAAALPLPVANNARDRAACCALLSSAFLASFGDDFFELFEVARAENSKRPSTAFERVGIQLLAPFQVLSGEMPLSDANPCADRGSHDPPEFQPLLRLCQAGGSSDSSSAHSGSTIGYWRDDPSEPLTMLAISKPNTAKQGPGVCFTPLDEPDLLIALHAQLKRAASANDLRSQACTRLADALLAASKCGAQHSGEAPKAGSALAARKKAWIAPTSHKMGIVVPYDKDTEVGYRALDPKGAELRKLLDKLEKSTGAAKDAALQELDSLLNWATIANDESDFGASLQLGLDIFNHAPCFATLAARTLSTTYRLLGRDQFATIAEMHAVQRKPK